MKYTITKMETPVSLLDEKKREVSLTGYSFIDEMNKCFIIVYGERKRDLMIEYLSQKGR